MAIERSQADPYVKEMAKWEQHDAFINGTFVQAIPISEGGRKGMPFAEFPKMLYRAQSEFGGYKISGCKVVGSEGEELVARGQGWSLTQEAALEAAPARDRELAELAANRAHNDRWMSEGARKEAQAADEATVKHLASIPETPIRKAGSGKS